MSSLGAVKTDCAEHFMETVLRRQPIRKGQRQDGANGNCYANAAEASAVPPRALELERPSKPCQTEGMVSGLCTLSSPVTGYSQAMGRAISLGKAVPCL